MKNHVKFEVSNALVEIPEEEILDYVRKNFYVHDVFSEAELHKWAEDNGYIID